MVELKMSGPSELPACTPTCMESVNRIVKLPVVECSIQTATNVYGRVKDLNSYTKWGFETMENTIHSVVETGKPYAIPVIQKLEGPIKKVDDVLCTGIDYVEEKIPAVKLPPGELYATTKGFVDENVSPKVDNAYKTVVDPAVQAAKKVTDPAMNLAKPTMEAAYKIVEPIVQPAVERAQALKDYSTQKVEEFLHQETIAHTDKTEESKKDE